MKLAVSAVFALALLAGNTGCRFFCPCYACDPCMQGGMNDCDMGNCGIDDCDGGCGGCGHGGCLLGRWRQCGCNVGPFGGCGGMGCSRRLHVFNWSRCRDCCDECAHWTGEGFVSQNGGFYPQPDAGASANYDESGPSEPPGTYVEPEAGEPGPGAGGPESPEAGEPSARVVPGSLRISDRDAEAEPIQIGAKQQRVVNRPRPIPAAPRRTKRINSTSTK